MAAPSAYQMLATGVTVGAASVARTGLGWLELCGERLPRVLALVSEAREDGGRQSAATGQLRDELLAIARGCSEIAIRELARGVDDVDALLRPDEPPSERPTRPYRAKP